jgi:hypothetical protein
MERGSWEYISQELVIQNKSRKFNDFALLCDVGFVTAKVGIGNKSDSLAHSSLSRIAPSAASEPFLKLLGSPIPWSFPAFGLSPWSRPLPSAGVTQRLRRHQHGVLKDGSSLSRGREAHERRRHPHGETPR